MVLKFPQKPFDQLKAAVDNYLKSAKEDPVAAFDADGTLWAIDFGETLFRYEIKNRLVPLPKDPWAHYEHLKANVSHEVAYLWLAQIHKGVPLTTVQEWAQQAMDEVAPVPLIPGQHELIQHFRACGVRVYIVTASIRWAVEPGAQLYGLDFDNVIGIRTKVDGNGLITDQQEGPITWREGKVQGLLEATDGQKPFFASGNTEGDLALLESATHLRLAIAASPNPSENYATEQRLQKIARERSWFAYPFTANE
jgi:HAD superfamily phosphoserine phosphatase-like hydrolase